MCDRAKCGTVIVNNNKVIASGYNAPPAELESQKRCNKKHELAKGFKSDRTYCVHAEQRAIMDGLAKSSNEVKGSTLYFTRINAEGELLNSGKPYCTIRSKMSLDAGAKYWVLSHEDGVKMYDAEEYNNISFAYDGE